MKNASRHLIIRTTIGLFLILFGSFVQAQSPNGSFSAPSAFQQAEPSRPDVVPAPFVSVDSKDAPELALPSFPQIVPLDASFDRQEIEQISEQGSRLIADRQWSEARSCFEKAVKKYPQIPEFKQNLAWARFHFEIQYRYNDRSYCSCLANSSVGDVLALYDEVLTNVESYHVDTPRWNELFESGLTCLNAAVEEEKFLTGSGTADATRADVLPYFLKLKEYCLRWDVRTKTDLRNAILKVAEQMYQNAGVSPNATIMEFVCGMTSSLDAYSSYLTLSQINDLYSIIDGQFVGLGVEIQLNSVPLLIERVISGSPAQQAGLQNGDQIVNIDGIDVATLPDSDQAGNLLQGKEGTSVALSVLSPDRQVRQVVVVRRRFDVPSVENIRLVRTPDSKKIGYLKITCFQKTTATELSDALSQLSRQGMQSLIIDLRKNPGGLLQEAIDVSNLFVENGLIVKTRGRDSERPYYADANGTWNVPLVLLIDDQSASAAEIFAGAIRENRRGRVVGTRSFGKGTVQAIIQLTGKNGSEPIAGLRLTTEKFYSPNGTAYSGVGVEPDVVVTESENPIRYVVSRPISAAEPNSNPLPNDAAATRTPNDDVATTKSKPDLCLTRGLEEARSLVESRY